MTSRIWSLVALFCLAACATSKTAGDRAMAVVMVEPSPDVPVEWRAVASGADIARIDQVAGRWQRALAGVRKWRWPAVAAEGALLAPDAGLTRPLPSPGRYRCRYLRLGQEEGGLRTFKPWFCFIADDGALTTLTKATGDERPSGRLWPDTDHRLIFLGAVSHGDDRSPLAYGDDRETNAAGIFERTGDFQWRLALFGREDAALDVIELVPDVVSPPFQPAMR